MKININNYFIDDQNNNFRKSCREKKPKDEYCVINCHVCKKIYSTHKTFTCCNSQCCESFCTNCLKKHYVI